MKKRKYQTHALTVAGKSQQISYFDGLGRPLQQVAVGGSGGLHDLVIPVEFDGYCMAGKPKSFYLIVFSRQVQAAASDQRLLQNKEPFII